jgi:biopolymer transport protein ExbD
MRFREGKNLIVRIDISPLVDVVFLLVIFFAVSTTFIEMSGLKLSLPQSSSIAEKKSEEITVFLTEKGEILYGETKVNRAELAEKLKDDLEISENKFVIIKADEKARHGDVVMIMDTAKNAGAEGMTIATKSKRQVDRE